MASLFESEVRYKIQDIKEFKKRIKDKGGKLEYEYSFVDYYFKPKKEKWELDKKNIRIRKWRYPERATKIYFSKTEPLSKNGIKFKRATYSEGKVPLLEADLEKCESILFDLGFEKWFEVDKNEAYFWEFQKQKFETVTENIKNLGWWGELEFEGKEINKAKLKIENALKFLKIPLQETTFKPISLIYQESLNKK